MKRILANVPLALPAFILAAVIAAGIIGSLSSCKTAPTKPDSFFGAVVTCTQENAYSTQAANAVVGCLVDAVGGDYSTCLNSLVTFGGFTVDEVACLIRQYVTTAAVKSNADKASPQDDAVLRNGNAWLKAHNITFAPHVGGGEVGK